jgi:CheY-like chemotaxis protein
VTRVVLIHWKEAEGAARVHNLKAAGYDASCLVPRGGSADLRNLAEHPPDALIVDLTRSPAQGRAVAIELRRRKGTRLVPLLFAGGDPEKVARLRALLPDAQYAEWDRIAEAIRHALATPAAAPVVPSTMQPYSGAPLVKKLGIRQGATVTLLNAPEDFEQTLGPLPEGVALRRGGRGAAQTVLLFTRSLRGLEKEFPRAARLLEEGGGIWIAWPKKASGITTDLSEAGVRRFGLASGFVDYKVCAIDQTWSGLLFARRKPDRT